MGESRGASRRTYVRRENVMRPKNRGEIRPQIANHVFCMGLAEKSCNVSTGKFI